METHWIVSITAISQNVCVLDRSRRFLFPNSKIFQMSHDLWPSSFDLTTIFQWSSLETKLRSKVIFSQLVLGYAETSVWFVHVTDCYCSGRGNSEVFSNSEISFCLKLPHINGVTLKNFGCVCLTETHVQWTGSFYIRKKEGVVVYVCNMGAMWLWQSISFRKNIENYLMLPHLTVQVNFL